jgi:SAM-dependent methyltransferase
MTQTSVIVPLGHDPSSAELDWLQGLANSPEVSELCVAGPNASAVSHSPSLARYADKLHVLHVDGGRGAQVRAAVEQSRGKHLLLQDVHPGYSSLDYARLLEPLQRGDAEAVYGNRFGSERAVGSYLGAWADRSLKLISNAITNLDLSDPDCGIKAYDGRALRGLSLRSDGDGIDAEITFKMAAQFYRVYEVALRHSTPPRRDPLRKKFAEAKTLLRYATSANDADNLHEGYNTLLRLDGAPHYNAWLGKKLRAHLGKRVLEVGAGIGTITRQIEAGRELVIALEVDPFYVEKLKNLFARKTNVMPLLSGVEDADWEKLRVHRIDSIVLSNVLEHIEDDAHAVQNFKNLLPKGGKLVILVPALPVLYGSIDRAVGHFRRYTPSALRSVLENQGFAIEHMEWLNLVGVPGWFLNGRVFKRESVPPLQLALYDRISPLLASLEDRVTLPVGMSLLAVARA